MDRVQTKTHRGSVPKRYDGIIKMKTLVWKSQKAQMRRINKHYRNHHTDNNSRS